MIALIFGMLACTHSHAEQMEKHVDAITIPQVYSVNISYHMPYIKLVEPIAATVDDVGGLQFLSFYNGLNTFLFNASGMGGETAFEVLPVIDHKDCFAHPTVCPAFFGIHLGSLFQVKSGTPHPCLHHYCDVGALDFNMFQSYDDVGYFCKYFSPEVRVILETDLLTIRLCSMHTSRSYCALSPRGVGVSCVSHRCLIARGSHRTYIRFQNSNWSCARAQLSLQYPLSESSTRLRFAERAITIRCDIVFVSCVIVEHV